MKIAGKIVAGKLKPDNPAAWPIAMRQFDGKRVTVEVEAERVRRSLRANARHWSVIVPLARHALNLLRGPELLPLNKDQTHYVLVTAFGASEETELGPVPVRSSLMDTKQFQAMDEKASLWLMDKGYGVPIGPEERVEAMIAEATDP